MRLYDVSQLPVMEGERIVGLIDESDILMAVHDREDRFKLPVAKAMTKNLRTVPSSTPLEELMQIFEEGYVALVVDGDEYHGLVTRIDVLNFMRRKLR